MAEDLSQTLQLLVAGQLRIERAVTDLRKEVSNLQDGQANIRQDISNLQDGQASIRQDVSNLRDGQASILAELKTLMTKTDVATLRAELRAEVANEVGNVLRFREERGGLA